MKVYECSFVNLSIKLDLPRALQALFDAGLEDFTGENGRFYELTSENTLGDMLDMFATENQRDDFLRAYLS